MKISCDKDLLNQIIIRILENGQPEVKNGTMYFDGQECPKLIRTRMLELLLFTGIEKYRKLAFDVIELDGYNMCHFTPMITSRIFNRYKDILPESCSNIIKNYLLSVRNEFIGTELDFVGVNDNFGMMSTYTVMSNWLIFDDHEMQTECEKRFGQLERLLKRRGVLSEYNSLTYTPLQLFVLASLAEAAPNDELRQIALSAQKRVWADILGHFHPSTGEITGPYSRHYILSEHTAYKFLYTLLNPENKIEIKDLVDNKLKSIETLYYLTAEYEINDEIFALLTDKKYPFEIYSTTEYSASTDATPEASVRNMKEEDDFYEYPAGVSGLYSYQTEYYGIGTATREWHNGVQTSSFTLEYRPDKPINGKCNTKQVYCRYLINDEEKEKQSFMDQGRKMAFGQKNKAVVLYKPKVAAIPAVYSNLPKGLAEHYKKQEISGNNGVSSAKLVISIPAKNINEIYVEKTKVSALPYRTENAQSVYIKDSDIFMAFHPLEITDLGRDAAMSITERDERIEITFWNYRGTKKDFSKREFLHVRNGFAVSVNSIQEIESFEMFVEKENKTIITDDFITTNHSRQTFVRAVDVNFDDMKLSCEYSPASEGIKNIACNDYPIEYPKLIMTGIDTSKLPYMDEKYQ